MANFQPVINNPFGHQQAVAAPVGGQQPPQQQSAYGAPPSASSLYGAPPPPGQATSAGPSGPAAVPLMQTGQPYTPSVPVGAAPVAVSPFAASVPVAASHPQAGSAPYTPPTQYGAPPAPGASSQPTNVGPPPPSQAGGLSGLQPAQGAPLSAAAGIHGVPPPSLYAVPSAATSSLTQASGPPQATVPTYGAPPQPGQAATSGPPQAMYGGPPAPGQPMQQQQQQARKKQDHPSPAELISGLESGETLVYNTNVRSVPPPAASRFVVVDSGNCGPRFIRSSLYKVPTTGSLADKSAIPFGCVMQPLADTSNGEEPVPLVEFAGGEPLRCNRCKAYINCHDKFVDGGRQYQCFLCAHINPVPESYFSPLQPNGYRHDLAYRPELCKGSIEFAAAGQYCTRPPKPMPIIFLIDVSAQAVQSGIPQVLAQSLKATLASFAETTNQPIGFVTYDDTAHFYNLNSNLQQPQMLVVPSLEADFVPLEPENNLLVTYTESKEQIETFLEKLSTMFSGARVTKNAFAIATKAAALLLRETGGKIIAFQTSMPSLGPGKLGLIKTENIGTEKERDYHKPQTSYYPQMADDLSKHQIGIDLFVMANSHVELASVSTLTTVTGGQVFYYPRFQPARDRLKVHHELFRCLTRTNGYDAVMRVRTSSGLDVKDYSGNFRLCYGSDMAMAVIDADKTFGIYLTHDGEVPAESSAGLQCALLYTTASGQRRIRIHTLALSVSPQMADVFKSSDVETVINLLARRALKLVRSQSLGQVRKMMVEQCIQMTYTFRAQCSTKAFNPGVLVLPEGLKLLPLYVVAFLKNVMLKTGRVSVDARIFHRLRLNSMSVGEFSIFVHPRMFALHDMPEHAGSKLADGNIAYPPWCRLNNAALVPEGCYMLDNGQRILVWVGANVSPEFVRSVFGVNHPREVEQLGFTREDNPLVNRIKTISASLQVDHPSHKQFAIVKQGDQNRDLAFMHMMVEERVEDTMSHSDALMLIHREVSKKMGFASA